MSQRTERARPRRGQGDDGAALVEFAFVMVLLFTLVFGIISFGLILSFKQDVTRAAAEGARAGAVALPNSTAQSKAQLALEDAVESFGGSAWSTNGCSRAGVTQCTAVVAPCDNEPTVDCVTVTLTYDYDDQPLYGDIPIVSAFFPDEITAESVARINP
jgi:Flp pilus assembly protein TadG